MKLLTEQISKQTVANFVNLETAIKTYDRNALVCGTPAWRYVYHTIHSADKWFINPCNYEEADLYIDGMENPDNKCEINLSNQELLEYLEKVKIKTLSYLNELEDEMLGKKPEGCNYSRLELILGQYRHISLHTGMINGQTVERTGKFPVYAGLDNTGFYQLKKGLYY